MYVALSVFLIGNPHYVTLCIISLTTYIEPNPNICIILILNAITSAVAT